MAKKPTPQEDVLTRFGVAVPEGLLKAFDERLRKKGMPTRSEALRQLIRDFVTADTWQSGKGTVFGSVTVTYNHDIREAGSRMAELQHNYKDIILCTTHIHASDNGCLEVLLIKGDVQRVKRMIEEMRYLKAILSLTPVIRSMV